MTVIGLRAIATAFVITPFQIIRLAASSRISILRCTNCSLISPAQSIVFSATKDLPSLSKISKIFNFKSSTCGKPRVIFTPILPSGRRTALAVKGDAADITISSGDNNSRTRSSRIL